MRHFQRTDKRTWSLFGVDGKLLGTRTAGGWHGRNFEIVAAEGPYQVKRAGKWGFNAGLVYGGLQVHEATSN